MMALPEWNGVSVWRIENTQGARRGKREVFSISPYEKMASPTNDGFAGTGQAAFPTKVGFAGLAG
jgi:hypothetical protein